MNWTHRNWDFLPVSNTETRNFHKKHSNPKGLKHNERVIEECVQRSQRANNKFQFGTEAPEKCVLRSESPEGDKLRNNF